MRIFPKNFNFFKLFEKQADRLGEAIDNVKALIKDGKLKRHAKEMEKIESACDDVNHEILDALNQTFITPLDREDIAYLACAVDGIVDKLEKLTNRLYIYQLAPIPKAVGEYLDKLEQAVQHVIKGVKSLRSSKKWPQVIEHCHQVNALEDEADELLRANLSKLFQEEKDPVKLIKLKEIYELLDDAVDSCQEVSVGLERILIKNI